MSEELNRRRTLSVFLIAFAGNIAWAVENQYYNVFLYNEIAPVPLYVSLMVTITAFVSTFTAIIMGAVSDIKGKRRFFFIYSFICWAFTTAMFPFAAIFRPVILAIFIAILFDSIMSYFGATAYDACLHAYVTDITTEKNRGKAVGIMEIMVLLTILIVYAAAGFIIVAIGYYLFFIIIGIVTGVIGVIGALIAKDSEKLKPLNVTLRKQLKGTFKKETIKENKNLFIILIGIGIWAIGFNVFFSFIIIYLQHHIGLSLIMASLVMFIGLFVTMILGIPMGILVDKVGRKKMTIIATVLESLFLFLFAFTVDIIFIIIMGIGWVLFMTTWRISVQTWVKDMFPPENSAQFSGYLTLFNVLIGMSIGPLIGGYLSMLYGKSIVIDGVSGTVPPPLIFIVGALIMLISLIPFTIAKEKKESKSKQD